MEKEIVGICRLKTHDGKLQEASSLWVDTSHRGGKLGQALLRTLIGTVKKGKVYIRCTPELSEYYARIGFRHVLEPPPLLPATNDRMVMMCEAGKQKPDSSLDARPDLLVIDGGKGQLSAVMEALKESELDIPVISLAKREEEVFVPWQSYSVALAKQSPAQFLLMRLRDEAHRFANRHRETRAAKKLTASDRRTRPRSAGNA